MKIETSKTIPAFYFDSGQLSRLVESSRKNFTQAQPFPHIVFDDFLPSPVASLLAAEFPGPDDIDWTLWGPGEIKHTKDKQIEKLGTSDETKFGPFTRHLMAQLNSAVFLEFLEKLTGVPSLIADPYFNGGGLHSTGRGGKLLVHADASRHPVRCFHQRLNLILFLNQDWKEEYGGHLELWSRDKKRCEKKILPIFNRCVLFDTGAHSYHGQPAPLTCPPDRRRNSLAVYYYVLDRQQDEHYDGFRDYVDWVPSRPEDKPSIGFYRFKIFVKRFLPPFLVKSIKRILKEK